MSGGGPAWPYRDVLVTGGAGYIGTSLVRRLAPRVAACGGRLRILCRRADSASEIWPGNELEILIGDVRDGGIWKPALDGADLVVHLAAQTSVYTAETDPLGDLDINVTSLLRLLEAARRTGRRPVILLAGTATQAGLVRTLPVDETAADAPVTLYDLHKTMAEDYLRYFVRSGCVRGASLRLANVYGPGPPSGSADRGVLNAMIGRALRGEKLTVYGTGDRLRDYIYVEDVASAFEAAALGIDRIDGEYFVIGTGKGTSIRDALALVVDRVFAKTGRRSEIVHVDPPRPLASIEERDFIADSSRFEGRTGWKPAISLGEGIDRTIDRVLAEEGAIT